MLKNTVTQHLKKIKSQYWEFKRQLSMEDVALDYFKNDNIVSDDLTTYKLT